MNVSMRRLRTTAVLTLAAAVALSATASCSRRTDTSESDGSITLTVDTFGTFGYTQAVKDYEASHPGIKINLRKLGELKDYSPRLNQWLAAGSGAGDIVPFEESTVLSYKQQSDKFVNLLDLGAGELKGDFPEWKWNIGLSSDGKKLVGVGTDAGPLSMCYRTDLFAKAGLPTDRDAVSALWPTWEKYLETGQRFQAKNTGAAWVDSGTGVFSPYLYQAGDLNYYDKDNNLIADSNPDVRKAWDYTMQIVESGLSAKLQTWSKDWEAGFKKGSFATIACPAWMLGTIKANAGDEGKGKWDVAKAPGPGGNWGGSFLGIPKQSKHQKEAYELLKYLTGKAGQVAAFNDVGNIPSNLQALDDPAVKDATNDYFNNAPTGQIFGAGVRGIKPVHLGPKTQTLREGVFEPAIRSVEQGQRKASEAWQTAISDAKREAG